MIQRYGHVWKDEENLYEFDKDDKGMYVKWNDYIIIVSQHYTLTKQVEVLQDKLDRYSEV